MARAEDVNRLCEGGELLDRILSRGGRYMEEDAKGIVSQILRVVAFCHLQGVVHRDLKPENFLFTTRDENAPMKIIDFGLSDFIRPGGLDAYARVYDIRNHHWDVSQGLDQPVNIFCPHHLISSTNVHITGLAYSYERELLVSYNDELIYLFQKEMGIDAQPKTIHVDALQKIDQPQMYTGHRNSHTIKEVSFFGPCDEYVASGSDCCNVYIWNKKNDKLIRMMVGDKRVVNSVEPHPFFPLLATNGYDENVKLWTSISRSTIPLPKNAEDVLITEQDLKFAIHATKFLCVLHI